MKYLCKPLIRCFLERSEALFLFFENAEDFPRVFLFLEKRRGSTLLGKRFKRGAVLSRY